MNSILTYRRKIFILFFIIISIFTVGIILFEHHQIKRERVNNLENIMDIYAESVYSFIKDNQLIENNNLFKIDELVNYFPDQIRVTIIDWEGDVKYDNIMDAESMENHLQRLEIQKAILQNSGTNVRVSNTNNIKYLYYAKKFDNGYFVRIAKQYDLNLQSFINSGNSFVYFILLFFIVCVLLINYFANQFTKSIQELRVFSQRLKRGMPISKVSEYHDSEVGQISADIIENYNLLQENRKQLATEREKLLQHFQYSEEGIAIFSVDRKNMYANSHFLQYLNLIIDKPTFEIEQVFNDYNFEEFIHFLDDQTRTENVFTKRFDKNGKQFNVRILIFDDGSFELYISDITKSEKTRLLKQEMTNNIAHELRTPVTSIRGYLETILNLDENDSERRNSFIDRAYVQTIRLSELIQDIGMLTKIEEASDRFQKEPVNMSLLLKGIGSDLLDKLKEKNITYAVDVSDDVIINGSRTLLYSIFRNLTENSISYAGESINIVIRCYQKNKDTYYFEYYDTGIGIEEKHLVRIFERFYRVNEGRTRNTGGSGLGLSIVKNAVLFHKGSIVARNRAEGGLSFLITFPK